MEAPIKGGARYAVYIGRIFLALAFVALWRVAYTANRTARSSE